MILCFIALLAGEFLHSQDAASGYRAIGEKIHLHDTYSAIAEMDAFLLRLVSSSERFTSSISFWMAARCFSSSALPGCWQNATRLISKSRADREVFCIRGCNWVIKKGWPAQVQRSLQKYSIQRLFELKIFRDAERIA